MVDDRFSRYQGPLDYREILGDQRKGVQLTSKPETFGSTAEPDSRPADHEWFQFHGMTCCKLCGIVQRADGKNKPCPGIVKVGLRSEDGRPAYVADLIKRLETQAALYERDMGEIEAALMREAATFLRLWMRNPRK